MFIEFDSLKRDKTLAERGLDFANAAEVLDGHQFMLEDDRKNYSESRFITVGMLDGHRLWSFGRHAVFIVVLFL
jgi:uncharacterized DUF497 family protein